MEYELTPEEKEWERGRKISKAKRGKVSYWNMLVSVKKNYIKESFLAENGRMPTVHEVIKNTWHIDIPLDMGGFTIIFCEKLAEWKNNGEIPRENTFGFISTDKQAKNMWYIIERLIYDGILPVKRWWDEHKGRKSPSEWEQILGPEWKYRDEVWQFTKS